MAASLKALFAFKYMLVFVFACVAWSLAAALVLLFAFVVISGYAASGNPVRSLLLDMPRGSFVAVVLYVSLALAAVGILLPSAAVVIFRLKSEDMP